MKKFLEDFKKFALKGNMIDLAVGMIIGSAFTSIVSSLVNDIFMPVLSIFTGKIDFSNMFIALDGNKYPTPVSYTHLFIHQYHVYVRLYSRCSFYSSSLLNFLYNCCEEEIPNL